MSRFLRKLLRRSLKDPPDVYIVCGGRRTGTTLLTAILCSDERTNLLGQEAQILTRMVEAYRWSRENFEDFGQSFFQEFDEFHTFYQDIMAQFADNISVRISSSGLLVLKNPELSKVILDLANLFPDAQLLATVRDPRDQVASELEVGARRVAVGIRDNNFQTRNVVAIAKNYIDYNKEILELIKQHPKRIYMVRYEDLVQSSEKTIKELRVATGLNVTFDCTKPWSRISPLAGLNSSPSTSDLYGVPIDSRSVGRFKRDLSTEEAIAVERICEDIMEKFDYQRSV